MRTFFLPLLYVLFLSLPFIGFSQVIVNAEIVEDELTGMVDIHIVGDSFTDIIGYQFGLFWDTDLIQFEKVTHFGMPTMNESNFGFKLVDYGHLMTAWTDPIADTSFSPSSHILFTARFKRIASGSIDIAFGKVGYSGPIEVFNKELVFEEFTSTQNKILTETQYVSGQILIDANQDCIAQDREVKDAIGVVKFDGDFNFFGILYDGYYGVELPLGTYEVTHLFSPEETAYRACVPNRQLTISEETALITLTHLIQSDSIPIPSDPVSDNTQGIENGNDGVAAPDACDNCAPSLDSPEHTFKNTQWLPEGTTWRYKFTAFEFEGPPRIAEYQLIGKTTIQGKECSILHKPQDWCLGRPQMDYIYKENDRLYYYDFEKEAFQLLYDFSVGVGEIYKVPLWKDLNAREDTLYIRVDSISIFQLDTLSLKQFYVSQGFMDEGTIVYYSDPYPIIEDIGNLKNFFHLVENGFCDYTHIFPLQCFTHPSYGTYSFAAENCETLILPTIEILGEEGRIFPNPAAQHSFVELPYQGIVNWKVYSMEGKALSEGEQDIQRNTPFSIPVDHLPSSLYYIVLFDEQQQVLRKLKFVKL